MPRTGQLGTNLSTLGNLELGQGAPATANIVGISESVSISDPAVATSAHLVALSDTVSLTESFVALSDGLFEFSDTATLTDSASTVAHSFVSSPATVTVSDLSSEHAGFKVTPSSSVSISEQSSLHAAGNINTSETVLLSDLVQAIRLVTQSVTDSATLQETFLKTYQARVLGSEIASVSDSLNLHKTIVEDTSDTIAVLEMFNLGSGHKMLEAVALQETVTIGPAIIIPGVNNRIPVTISGPGLTIEGLIDRSNYTIVSEQGANVGIESIEPRSTSLQSGSLALAIYQGSHITFQINLSDATVIPAVGDYIFLNTPVTPVSYARVLSFSTNIDAGYTVTVDTPILMFADPVSWSHTTAIRGMVLHTTKATNGGSYILKIKNLKTTGGVNFSLDQPFSGVASRPGIVSAELLSSGSILVTFTDDMRIDGELTDPAEYSITDDNLVTVEAVRTVSKNQVILIVSGLTTDNYVLTVNAHGTPKDVAGNPIDPTFNTAVFSGDISEINRSIFVDRGPISKPALVLSSGINAHITSFTKVTLPGANLTSSAVGLYLKLTGGLNDGSFRIASVLGPTSVQVVADFLLPDPFNSTLGWQIIDPRNGQIADDPSDVRVTINGTPVTPDAVIGLLGQVVLPSTPSSTDDVKVSYSWILNPTVDIRRLNSKEFTLNNWNRNLNQNNETQHAYRYNNILPTPGSYVPDDLQSVLPQPLQRDVFYEAYERKYTALTNDPNSLVLNSPIHKIAFPPLERTISPVSVQYNGGVLPENLVTDPWVRNGSGSTTISSNELVVQATANPIYWTKSVDLTFSHVFASTWRVVLNSTPTLDGVYTGVSIGWANDKKALVVGYLNDAGTGKIGFLVKGQGNDPSQITSWSGGLSGNTPTNAPATLDSTVLHSYRIFRGSDGVVRLYVDGGVTETLRIDEDSLPFLEELNDPFNQLQGAFFGSLSRIASSTSTWDFYRYAILPTNPEQTSPASFVSYEANNIPEIGVNPWTPVGYHGTETILGGDFLLLDSTSVTSEVDQGIINGDFRGFTRIEPLMATSSNVDVDFRLQVRSFTSEISPDAMMVAVDDGNRLIQMSLLGAPTTPIVKYSYPGRVLPPLVSPTSWTAVGGVVPQMVGQTLRINDTTVSDGLVYSTTPILTGDYVFESRLKINSYVVDGSGFAGAFVSLYDTVKSVGIMFEDVLGIRYVTFHSDGTVIKRVSFEWFGTGFHTYRVILNSMGNLVTLFVDGVLLSSNPYTGVGGFTIGAGGSSQDFAFGSSTPSSMAAKSNVDWMYVNSWQPAPVNTKKYVGIWKGADSTSLVGYHLPTKLIRKTATVDATGLLVQDATNPFVSASVGAGDVLIIDDGPNKGAYLINTAVSSGEIQLLTPLPQAPNTFEYRIPETTDWTSYHAYRILRDSTGVVALYLDGNTVPAIKLDYNPIDLPVSSLGLPSTICNGMPSITFGAFDPLNLSQTSWDYVRYGITNAVGGARIVPHHMVLNQRNVIASPEHLSTTIAHTHTDFWSSSTGIPPQSFFDSPGLNAFTQLNEGTPIVPKTQTFEVRRPTPVQSFVASLNTPQDVLNTQGSFVLNDATTQVRLLVPDDVLYNSLKVTETSSGSADLLYPASDEASYQLGSISFQNVTCLQYTGDVLPELDPNAATPWTLASTDPSHVQVSTFNGLLTYGVDSTGTTTLYRNYTPLPDAIGLQTEVKFVLKVVVDSTGGTGDTGIRFGFSAIGLTAALAFVTDGFGDRAVQLIDLNNNSVVGSLQFDYLDGSFHTYRLVKDQTGMNINLYIDS